MAGMSRQLDLEVPRNFGFGVFSKTDHDDIRAFLFFQYLFMSWLKNMDKIFVGALVCKKMYGSIT